MHGIQGQEHKNSCVKEGHHKLYFSIQLKFKHEKINFISLTISNWKVNLGRYKGSTQTIAGFTFIFLIR